jgi:hypothetical protein
MNKVMVTGLAIGTEIGSCGACNFDLNWMVNDPSILLWADKIVFTPVMWNCIINEKLHSHREEFSKAIKFVFEKLNSEGVIEICKPKEVIDENMKKHIEGQVCKDMETLSTSFPSVISLNFGGKNKEGKRDPNTLKINDFDYCQPSLTAIYGSLMLSRLIEAQPLFNNRSFEFLKYRFGIDINNCQTNINTFNSIFSMAFPNEIIFPEIVLTNEKSCNTCGKINICRKDYLKYLDDKIDEIVKWRKYDEIFQIKTVINDIIADCNHADMELDYKDIIKKYREKENKANILIKSTFPKVKRFANIATLISLPFAVLGAATNDALITTSGLSVAALGLGSKEVLELLESKFRWIGFLKKKLE